MGADGRNQILFETGNIKVTASRFSTSDEIFPIKKIIAVRVEAEKRKFPAGIALVVAGIVALLGGMLGQFPALIVSGAAFTVGGGMLCFAKINRSLVLTMRGQDVTALTSKDAALIQSVASAVRNAIEQRR